MSDKALLIENLLNAASNGVQLELTFAFDMRGLYNWGINPRMINEDMIVFSRGDNGYYDIGDKRYPLKKGRFLFISHDMFHASGQSAFEFANVIAIRYRLIDRATGEDAAHRCPVGGFAYDCDDIKLYENLFMSVYHRRFQTEPSDYLLTHFCIISIYAKLLSDMRSSTQKADFNIPEFMEQACIYIDSCIRESKEVDAGRLAARLQMSRTALYRRFDKAFRVTFREYVYTRRMAYAAYLLNSTNMKVKQIASKLRYSDQYIFANMFKQFYGVSPGSYTKYYPG